MKNYNNNGLEDETPTTKNDVMNEDGIESTEIVESEIVEPESVNAEIMDDVEDGNDTGVAASPSHQSSDLLTARALFQQAMMVSAGDPARQLFGFFYEEQLRRECEAMLEFPIGKNDLAGLANAFQIRRFNPGFFQCTAIDAILNYYWNACNIKEAKQ